MHKREQSSKSKWKQKGENGIDSLVKQVYPCIILQAKILDWITGKGEYSSLVGRFHLLMLYPLSQFHCTPSIYLQQEGAFSLINLSGRDVIAHLAFYLRAFRS